MNAFADQRQGGFCTKSPLVCKCVIPMADRNMTYASYSIYVFFKYNLENCNLI